MLSQRQLDDSKECEELSERGSEKDCLGCSCSVCIATYQGRIERLQQENKRLTALLKRLQQMIWENGVHCPHDFIGLEDPSEVECGNCGECRDVAFKHWECWQAALEGAK